jgi:Ser/Thr protein kinase RdoA (MazF antagonist)
MSKTQPNEIVTESLHEHPAVKAWCELQHAWIEPGCLEVLKLKHKVATYRLNGIGPQHTALIAKRCRTATAKIERMIYNEILPRVPVPALHCYGFLEEPGGEFCWLFLEEADGEMYSPARAEHRTLAGHWLGMLHRAPLSARITARLPDRGPAHYLQRLRGVRAKVGEHVDHAGLNADDRRLLRSVVAHCDALESCWNEIEECCTAMPRTLVHADLVIKNLRVRNGTAGSELLIFDWELAGWGVPATDLAQFVGRTASPDLAVYRSVLRQDFGDLDERDIQRLADCGRLLRLVDELYWATTFIAGNASRFLIRPISHFRLIEPQLAIALSDGKRKAA